MTPAEKAARTATASNGLTANALEYDVAEPF
jgi:hypothetical protein